MSPIKFSDFLSPWKFTTEHDVERGDDYPQKQYQKGLKTGIEYDTISINSSLVWSASVKNGRKHIVSYETIGYHRCTAQLLEGFLASPAKIVFFHCEDTIIKPSQYKLSIVYPEPGINEHYKVYLENELVLTTVNVEAVVNLFQTETTIKTI